MTAPEEALERARMQLAQMRANGAYGEPVSHDPLPATDAITAAKLFEWALVEPDLRDVRSTRRAGAPITALKRMLVRLLSQYHGVLTGEQNRFNLNLVIHVRQLEHRIAELERESDQLRRKL